MRTIRLLVALTAVILLAPLLPAADAQAGPDPAVFGSFGAPFEEPGEKCTIDADGRELCKPAGTTSVVLANGQNLFWDALEGTENVNLSIVFEFAHQARNDRSRVLDLNGDTPRFITPTPEDAGANPDGDGGEYIPGLPIDDPIVNDGDLFCSDQVHLPDGRVLTVGGTDYYAEPYLGEVQGNDYGVVELEGIKNSRIFDPYTQTWSQSGSMNFGRWYPSLVSLPDGDVFVASGVTKLLKPVYPERPLDSGTNVKQTETYDPATGEWTLNPATADRSLPLYPRLHLLPNGNVYYDAGGQVFNPFGQSYDEAFWNIASTFNPETRRWRDLGVPGLGLGALDPLGRALDAPGMQNGDLTGIPLLDGLPLDGLPFAGGDLTGVPGFRGSTFSMMLPLEANEAGDYTEAEFLSAGGVLGTSPGTYLGSSSSQINTVTMGDDGSETLSSRATGPLAQPRWYGTGVQLPTGEVLAFSGASADEVLLPGTAKPVTTPELFDPETETWQPLASQGRERTYHNTAVLLPDARVLVGGHAPISTAYGFNVSLPGASPQEGRDPSFEIFTPPNLFYGERPTITEAPDSIPVGEDATIDIVTPEAAEIAAGGTVVLTRNTALTHLVDSDQRTVELPILGVDGDTLTVAAPPDRAVTPDGPYLLFLNRPAEQGLVPSVADQVFVGVPVPTPIADTDGARDAVDSEPGFVPRTPPHDVLLDNLDDALGLDQAALGQAAISAEIDPALLSSTRDQPAGIPPALLVLAAVLPAAVLLRGWLLRPFLRSDTSG
ncbi:hypothetical protein BH20ACT2_BH20ACT2_13090 [soil metagenome]